MGLQVKTDKGWIKGVDCGDHIEFRAARAAGGRPSVARAARNRSLGGGAQGGSFCPDGNAGEAGS